MKKRIYFCGGAFGSAYYIGALKAIYEQKLHYKSVYGNSAGALFGMLCILRMPTDDISRMFQDIIHNTTEKICNRPFCLDSYQLTEPNLRLLRILDQMYPNAYALCNRRLHIGITKESSGFVWKSRFSSNDDLFNALLCSYNIPFVCNYDARVDGERCVDGCIGFDIRRHLPDNTLTIGANNPHCMLNGNISLLRCLLPPTQSSYNEYVERGYRDFCSKTMFSECMFWFYNEQTTGNERLKL
jgi:hypothetical protein